MNEIEAPAELKAFPIGHVVAERYEVLGYLGHGGMSFVLKAKDLTLDNEIVALKILLSKLGTDVNSFARFRREVLLSRKLSHPNIVRIYDFGDAGNDTYFISMEYIEGENLRSKLDQVNGGGLAFNEIVKYIHQIATGLSYAHSQGIIHRDIKPANMLLNKNSEIKITDFGVARSMESTERLTATDEAVGSPLYMAPEQLDSNAIDHRSDIYAFGIMAYELAVGRPPFYSDHWVMLVKMHMTSPIPEFASKEKGIPFWYQELVSKAAAKDPEKRFQTAQEIIDFIPKQYLNDSKGSNAKKYSSAQQPVFAFAILMIALSVFLVLGLGGYLIFGALSK